MLRERLLAARVLALAALVPLITRLSLPRQERLLEPRRPARPDAERAAWLAENVDGLIAMAHPVVRPGCLTRGLTHYYFLRRAGVEVRLAYGIGGRIEGSLPPARVRARRAGGKVRGAVSDAFGHPVSEVPLVLQRRSGGGGGWRRAGKGTASMRGTFALRAAGGGEYRVVASLAGSTARSRAVRAG